MLQYCWGNMILDFGSNALVHKRAQRIIRNKQGSKTSAAKEIAFSLRKADPDKMLSAALRELPSLSKIRAKLDKSGKTISLRKYFAWCLVSIIGSIFFVKSIIGFGLVFSIILGIILGLIIPNKIVSRWITKRNKKFVLLFPDALELMVRGLRSGLPVGESINVIKDEIPEPVSQVFAEISSAIRMGVPFEEALNNSAQKLNIQEFNFFVISIALQRETGGNLAEILENLAETIRARGMMKLKIRAMSSEARMSAYIVGALPFLVILALKFMSPNYLTPLFEDIRGNVALFVAFAMFSIGMLSMRKMGNFEI